MSKFQIFRKIASIISIKTLRSIIDIFRYYLKGIWKRMDEDHIFLSAAGIAFSLVLSIIPFVLIVFAVIGNVISIELIQKQIGQLIATVIPYGQYADYIQQLILNRVPAVIEYKTWAGYMGIFGLFFTSTWLFSSMRTILNSIFGVREEKSAFYGMVRDFGMVILLMIFLLLSMIFIPFIDYLKTTTIQNDFLIQLRINDLFHLLFSALSLTIIFGMFFIFYYFIPYEKLGKKVPVISALWATILWEAMRYLFGYYVAAFLSTNKLYGAFLFIIVVMFWIFYSSILFVLGAEIGQLYRLRNQKSSLI